MIGELNDLLALLKEMLTGFGVEHGIVQIVSGFLATAFLLYILIKQIIRMLGFLVASYRNKLLAKDLHPFFTYKEIQRATKYFVETKFQNVSPSEDDEPGRSYIAAAKQPLIPLFINKAFRNDSDDTKYYLILADSGMGKTTFMINLLIKYRFRMNWPWRRKKFDIILLPLGDPESLKKLKSFDEEKRLNTILLLDAFDENNEAIENYEEKLKEVLDLVWDFREIVISCRTQFFPSSTDEPSETGKFKFGPSGGQFIFQKIYISPFSKRDIKRYLSKKYKIFYLFKSTKYYRALAIVLKSPYLMMRPMLLSHIDDLVQDKKRFNYSYEIYGSLIKQWLIRESNKSGIIKKYGKSYKKLLFEFSRSLSRYLYQIKLRDNKPLSIHASELIDNPNGLQLNDLEGNLIEISGKDQSTRSLLNRNAVGEYKFSHKSIFEYFIAFELIQNPEFREGFKFPKNLDTAKRFFLEMLVGKNIQIPEYQLVKLGISTNDIKESYKLGSSTTSSKDIFKAILSVSIMDLLRILVVFITFFYSFDSNIAFVLAVAIFVINEFYPKLKAINEEVNISRSEKEESFQTFFGEETSKDDAIMK